MIWPLPLLSLMRKGNFSQRLGDGIYMPLQVLATDDILYFDIYIEFEVVNGIPSIDFSLFDVGAVQGKCPGSGSKLKNGFRHSKAEALLDIVGSWGRTAPPGCYT